MQSKDEYSRTDYSSEKRFLLRWFDMVTMKKITNCQGEEQSSLVDYDISTKAMCGESSVQHHLAACERYQQLANFLPSVGSNYGTNAYTPIDALSVDRCDDSAFISMMQQSQITTVGKNDCSITPLHMAASDGYQEVVKILLDVGADIDAQDSHSNTPLHLAAVKGHKEVVNLLMDEGAAVDKINHTSSTALFLAIWNEHQDLVKLLIERDAAVDTQDCDLETALHAAVSMGYPITAKLLLEKGAAVDALDENQTTALHLAVRNGYEDLVKLLIESGANVDTQDCDLGTALHAAASMGYPAIAKLLLEKGAAVDAVGKNGKTALHFAAQEGYGEVVELLLNGGADIEAQDNSLVTALNDAIRNDHQHVVSLLLERGANVDTQDCNGKSALHAAASIKDLAIAKLLLEKGATVGAVGKNRKTALHFAAQVGYGEIVELLLDGGADIEAQDISLVTALNDAIWNDHQHVVSLLLERGANVDTQDCNGKSALHAAASIKNLAIAKLLLEKGATVDAEDLNSSTALHFAVIHRHKPIVEVLLDGGASINQKDRNSNTALHFAVRAGWDTLVELLLDRCTTVDAKDGSLDRSATVDAKDGQSRTALELATHSGHSKIAHVLLNHGANLETTNEKGETPLLIASKSSLFELIDLFINNGADMEATDMYSLTALHSAAKDGNVRLIDLLIAKGAKLDTRTNNGDTALHIAVKFNQSDAATTLIKHGAEINDENQEKQTPVQIAILQDNADLMCLLLKADSDIKNPGGDQMPLIDSIADTGKVEFLLRALNTIDNVDQKTLYMNKALLRSSQHGDVDLVKHLLDIGADIESSNQCGQTSLFLAGEYPEIMAMLLHRGASMQAFINKKYEPALHYYASLGKDKAIAVLLSHGYDIQSYRNGYTALHTAISANQPQVATLLIEKGIDINAVNGKGETALHLAIKKDFHELVKLLVYHGSNLEVKSFNLSTALKIAVKSGNEKAVEFLLNSNADVNGKLYLGRTALHVAVQYKLAKMAALLIKHGANVNAMTNGGRTPLFSAVENQSVTMVKMLLDGGASVNITDIDGFSPLVMAFQGKNRYKDFKDDRFLRYDREVVVLLLTAGADVTCLRISEEWKQKLLLWQSTLRNSTIKAVKMEAAGLNAEKDIEHDTSAVVLKIFSDNWIHNFKTKPRPTKRLSNIRHKYGYGFPSSRKLRYPEMNYLATSQSLKEPSQTLKLLHSISIEERANTLIETLLRIFDVHFFISDQFFMLQLDDQINTRSPKIALPFDRMDGIIREPGRLLVQIPPERNDLLPRWNKFERPYLRFIRAVYVCRRLSNRVDHDAFSEILGESEANIATDLHAMLIAGLSILSITDSDAHIDQLVKAILGEKVEDIQGYKSMKASSDWRILNRVRCQCMSQFTHRPLSPIAAAKAVGIDIWHTREEEIVTRVWDLESDTLLTAKKTTDVIFITHTWAEHEVDYSGVKDCKGGRQGSISKKSKKLKDIRTALRKYKKYVWLDTICIDKSNMTELDEAIRSMHKWYKNCAAVVLESGTRLGNNGDNSITGIQTKTKNGWCERGWCLQEGVAAGILCGITPTGELLSIQQLAKEQEVNLCTLDLHFSYRPGNAAEILARMDARETTRKEDKAYALAGIFSIYLPLAYGEGLKSRERLLHELAIQEGDLSFLSFPSKETSFGNLLPGTDDINYQLANCRQSSAPVMVSHFGISFEVQLVEDEGVSKILKILNDWKDLKIAEGRFVGLTNIIEEAKAGQQEYSNLKVAIVHDIRSIMLVMEYGEDWQTGGGRPVKLCYRLQCCQIEEDEFERLFDDVETDYGITASFERIWLGDKRLTLKSNSRKKSVHPKRKR